MMDRKRTERGFRHIVDVDGLLLGIEHGFVDAAELLGRAGAPSDHVLSRRIGDGSFEIPQGQPIALSETEVMYFASAPSCSWSRPALAA